MLVCIQSIIKNIIRSHSRRRMSSSVKGLYNVGKNQEYYVWIDLEMTGLDEKVDKILEVACIVTNNQLNILDPGIYLVIHQPMEVLNKANGWCKVNFTRNGLLEEMLDSKMSVEEADELVSNYVKKLTCHDQGKVTYYLAGNSVYMDKRFLEEYMKNTNKLLHYRLVDVSAIKTVCSHWYPKEFCEIPPKISNHRALNDIKESINELKIYREKFFKPQ